MLTAWLITLALFWAVGSWIAKGIDLSNSKSFKQAEYRHAEHEKFLDNLYVAAWPYYQHCEQQAIQEWERAKYPGGPFHTSVFADIQIQLYGTSMEQYAVRKGWEFMYLNGIAVYQANPVAIQRQNYGSRYVPATNMDIDFQELYWEVRRDWSQRPLSSCYNYEYVCRNGHRVHAKLRDKIPIIDDPRVRYYSCYERRYPRPHCPPDYDVLVYREKRKQIKQLIFLLRGISESKESAQSGSEVEAAEISLRRETASLRTKILYH